MSISICPTCKKINQAGSISCWNCGSLLVDTPTWMKSAEENAVKPEDDTTSWLKSLDETVELDDSTPAWMKPAEENAVKPENDTTSWLKSLDETVEPEDGTPAWMKSADENEVKPKDDAASWLKSLDETVEFDDSTPAWMKPAEENAVKPEDNTISWLKSLDETVEPEDGTPAWVKPADETKNKLPQHVISISSIERQKNNTLPKQINKRNQLYVFLCHSSGDKPAVRKLYRQLSKEKWIDPWLDEDKLDPGDNWKYEIRKAVRNSDIVLVCISESSINKEGFIQKEIRFALDVADEKPEGTIFIIPLKLEACTVPDRLSDWQWVNYYEQGAYGRLMRSLRKRAKTLGIETE